MAEATQTSFAMLDYAGHGEHPMPLDDASRAKQFQEVIEVYDRLREMGYQNIIAIGGSFGGYMAALLAGERPLAGLVLRAPANYPDEEFQLAYSDTSAARGDKAHYLYRQSIGQSYTNRAVEAVRQFSGATYVIEHQMDEVINPSIPRSYFGAAQQGNYLVIPGLKHSPKLMPDPRPYFALIESWLVTIVKAIQQNKKLEQ